MDDKRFWDIISVGCPHDAVPEEDWASSLVEVLKHLDPDDIIGFEHSLDEKADAAYCREMWSVASMINGGASDDGFYYFRLWLVAMGKKVYESAIANPDSLADVVDPQNDYEVEIYGVARHAWEAQGLAEKDFDSAYSAKSQRHPRRRELVGEWVRHADFPNRFPRLAGLYLSGGDA